MKLQLRLLTLLLLAFLSAGAQQRKVTAYYGIADNALIRTRRVTGGGDYDGKGTQLFGVRYMQHISPKFVIEAGMEYVKNDIDITPAPNPNIDRTPHRQQIELVSIPVQLRGDFLRYFFAQFGPLIDAEINRNNDDWADNQSGIGLGAGVGGRVPVGKFEVFVNPFLNFRAIIAFESEHYRQHLAEAGLRSGIGYNL